MSMYKIEYFYKTGNSFTNCERTELLEMEWKDLDVAKANLQRIKEHYKFYQQLVNTRFDEKQALIETHSQKDWIALEKRLAARSKTNPLDWTVIETHHIERLKKDNEIFHIYDVMIAENCLILRSDEFVPWQFWAPWCGHFETLYSAKIIIEDKDMEVIF